MVYIFIHQIKIVLYCAAVKIKTDVAKCKVQPSAGERHN